MGLSFRDAIGTVLVAAAVAVTLSVVYSLELASDR
jgi:hypothetical protein